MEQSIRCAIVLTTAGLVAGVTGCRAPATPSAGAQDAEVRAGWEWSDQEVFETVNQVRAGRSLQPESWPGGARVAVLLSFDVDNETIPLRYGEPTIGGLSQGEYGARVALPRVVSLLDERGIPASFFIPAVSLKTSAIRSSSSAVWAEAQATRTRKGRAEFMRAPSYIGSDGAPLTS